MDKYDPRHTPSEDELTDMNDNWTEADEAGKEYDPNRGDHVDHLNDTTPAPRPQAAPRTKKRGGKGWPWLVVLVLLLVAAGAAYYWFAMRTKTAAPAKSQATAQATTEAPKTTQSDTTKHYDSPLFAVGLDYPDTWKINDGDTKLAVTSPQTTFKDPANKQVSGYMQLNIESRQTTLPEFAKGAATAVRDSEKIVYKKPTKLQRAQTYLTFAGYAPSTPTGLDAIYVTGDNGYKLSQTVPMSDVIQTDPLVRVTFLSCTDQTCSGKPTALKINAADWKDAELSAPLKTILQSLSFN